LGYAAFLEIFLILFSTGVSLFWLTPFFIYLNYVHFLCLPKENEPKERVACSLGLRLPCAAHKEQAPRKVASLHRVANLHFVALLGCVKWHEKPDCFLLLGPHSVPLSIANVDGIKR
jgi:hypothetical protein